MFCYMYWLSVVLGLVITYIFCLRDTHLHAPILQRLVYSCKNCLRVLTVLLKDNHVVCM